MIHILIAFETESCFHLRIHKVGLSLFQHGHLENEDQPKYLNTPETVLFNKSSLLYNFYEARSQIRKQGIAILFEGFADVISADAAK